jgi:hypothetical protein
VLPSAVLVEPTAVLVVSPRETTAMISAPHHLSQRHSFQSLTETFSAGIELYRWQITMHCKHNELDGANTRDKNGDPDGVQPALNRICAWISYQSTRRPQQRCNNQPRRDLGPSRMARTPRALAHLDARCNSSCKQRSHYLILCIPRVWWIFECGSLELVRCTKER